MPWLKVGYRTDALIEDYGICELPVSDWTDCVTSVVSVVDGCTSAIDSVLRAGSLKIFA